MLAAVLVYYPNDFSISLQATYAILHQLFPKNQPIILEYSLSVPNSKNYSGQIPTCEYGVSLKFSHLTLNTIPGCDFKGIS